LTSSNIRSRAYARDHEKEENRIHWITDDKNTLEALERKKNLLDRKEDRKLVGIIGTRVEKKSTGSAQ